MCVFTVASKNLEMRNPLSWAGVTSRRVLTACVLISWCRSVHNTSRLLASQCLLPARDLRSWYRLAKAELHNHHLARLEYLSPFHTVSLCLSRFGAEPHRSSSSSSIFAEKTKQGAYPSPDSLVTAPLAAFFSQVFGGVTLSRTRSPQWRSPVLF